jgi:hypothetical protein
MARRKPQPSPSIEPVRSARLQLSLEHDVWVAVRINN